MKFLSSKTFLTRAEWESWLDVGRMLLAPEIEGVTTLCSPEEGKLELDQTSPPIIQRGRILEEFGTVSSSRSIMRNPSFVPNVS